MITWGEPTSVVAVAPDDVALVAVKRKNDNLEAREIYAREPYYESRARVKTSLRSVDKSVNVTDDLYRLDSMAISYGGTS